MIRILENIDNWTCDYKKCAAKCCTPGIQLTLRDIKKIKKLGYSTDDFLEFDEIENVFKIRSKDGKCFFLGEGFKCTIWDKEPVVCRLLPFKITKVSYSDEPIMCLRPVVDCPGEGAGGKIDNKRIETDAMSFLHENQKLIRDLKKKGKNEILKEI